MNKLIEKLTEQAVEEMDQEAFSEDMYIPDEYLEKFAELIIKECSNIILNEEIPDLEFSSEVFRSGHDRGMIDAVHIMKDRFGVNDHWSKVVKNERKI